MRNPPVSTRNCLLPEGKSPEGRRKLPFFSAPITFEGRGAIGAEPLRIDGDLYLPALPPDHLELAHVRVLLQLVDDVEGDPAKLVAVVAGAPEGKARMGTSSIDLGFTSGWETPGGILS